MSKDLRLFCIEHGIDLDELGPVGEISDGYHAFDNLYHQRAVLFAALCNIFPNYSWKSWKHEDGKKCFGSDDWFIVGIETPKGPYTYHYEAKYWDMFKCREVDQAPEWDGHTDKEVDRLLSLEDYNTKRIDTVWINEFDKRPDIANLFGRVNAISPEDCRIGIDIAKGKDLTGRIAPGYHLPVMDGPDIRRGKEPIKYRNKLFGLVIVEALQWDGANHREMWNFLTGKTDDYLSPRGDDFYIDHSKVNGGLIIKTPRGDRVAAIGDYIIKNIIGEFFPLESDFFECSYKEV